MDYNEPAEIVQRKQQVAKVFDGAAATYSQIGPQFFSHFGNRLVEIAQIGSGSSVLDVATGRGAVLYPAARAVGSEGSVIGIDLSEKMVQETRQELASNQSLSNIDIRLMDAEHLQFPDKSFDYILCGFAIFFFPQLYKAMTEFQRVLKPGGKICVSTFDERFYKEWDWFQKIVETYLPPESQERHKAETDKEARPVFDTAAGVEAILNQAGFSEIQVFSEEVEAIYQTQELFWSTLWSHGIRGTLERIEQSRGAEGLKQFKFDVFTKLGSIMEADGFHQLIPIHISVGTKQMM